MFFTLLFAMSLSSSIAKAHFFRFNDLLNHQKVIINDGVMGGFSRSKAIVESDHMVFSGVVSLDNNGGFASVRMLWPFSTLTKSTTIRLTFKADGKHYQFRLRTDKGVDGAAYVYEFITEKKHEGIQWQSIDMVLSDFVPQFRGRILKQMPELHLSDIKQMSVLIAGKQSGPFEIALKQIALVD